ncbi:MAG: hypothetical protein PHY47_00860 [Lachnospiraceae bacterium]|nr:hypothetical protein [Lachnospiraceae bacterium]
MRFLPLSDQKYFEDFFQSRIKDSFLSNERLNNLRTLSHRILFETFRTTGSNTECRRTCHGCDMYTKERCNGMESIDRWGDKRNTQPNSNTQYAASELNYYNDMTDRINRSLNELYLILGKYRVDSYIEHIYQRASDSVLLHNKLNPKHKKPELKTQDLKYWSSHDIAETDSWLKFKNKKTGGELLCSLLSDF